MSHASTLGIRLITLAIILAIGLASGGCGGRGTIEAVQKFDGLTITVRSASGQMMNATSRQSEEGVHTFKAGDFEYVVDHMRLSVNGRKYGELKTGDEVLIEGERVWVNGAERQPD